VQTILYFQLQDQLAYFLKHSLVAIAVAVINMINVINEDTSLSFPRRRESIFGVVRPMDSRFHGNDVGLS